MVRLHQRAEAQLEELRIYELLGEGKVSPNIGRVVGDGFHAIAQCVKNGHSELLICRSQLLQAGSIKKHTTMREVLNYVFKVLHRFRHQFVELLQLITQLVLLCLTRSFVARLQFLEPHIFKLRPLVSAHHFQIFRTLFSFTVIHVCTRQHSFNQSRKIAISRTIIQHRLERRKCLRLGDRSKGREGTIVQHDAFPSELHDGFQQLCTDLFVKPLLHKLGCIEFQSFHVF
mmetsp:Transcript_5250/g.14890  ORF Transcript_5250/g.14890 Transcript_5250/m.14890 type:complete len:230 (-) Transcript_5250:199-888(-)